MPRREKSADARHGVAEKTFHKLTKIFNGPALGDLYATRLTHHPTALLHSEALLL